MAKLHDYTVIHVGMHMLSQININDDGDNIDGKPAVDRLAFSSYDKCCAHVTANWQLNFVLPVVDYVGFFESQLLQRPFFVLIHVQAPLSLRPARPDDDRIMFEDPGLAARSATTATTTTSTLTLLNNGSLAELQQAVLDKLAPSLLQTVARPPWDAYFMSLAHLAERRSNCMKRRVGAVVVVDNRVMATGYNGTPRHLPNCLEGGCPRCNGGAPCGQQLDACLCLHAEENAILEAGRARSEGGTLYCTTRPCLGCAKKIVQVGIARMVWEREYSPEHDSLHLFQSAGVACEQYRPGVDHVVSCKPMIK